MVWYVWREELHLSGAQFISIIHFFRTLGYDLNAWQKLSTAWNRYFLKL